MRQRRRRRPLPPLRSRRPPEARGPGPAPPPRLARPGPAARRPEQAAGAVGCDGGGRRRCGGGDDEAGPGRRAARGARDRRRRGGGLCPDRRRRRRRRGEKEGEEAAAAAPAPVAAPAPAAAPAAPAAPAAAASKAALARARKAVDAALSLPGNAFGPTELATALSRLMVRSPLPLLFFRVLLQAQAAAPSLRPFVVDVLGQTARRGGLWPATAESSGESGVRVRGGGGTSAAAGRRRRPGRDGCWRRSRPRRALLPRAAVPASQGPGRPRRSHRGRVRGGEPAGSADGLCEVEVVPRRRGRRDDGRAGRGRGRRREGAPGRRHARIGLL